MKCNSRLLYTTKRKRPFSFASNASEELISAFRDKFPDGQWKVCNGKIIATVAAIDEPFFGGMSAVLEISYTCNHCNQDVFPNLPDKYGLSNWITKRIEEL